MEQRSVTTLTLKSERRGHTGGKYRILAYWPHEWVLALLSQQQRSWPYRQCWGILAKGARLLVREVALNRLVMCI